MTSVYLIGSLRNPEVTVVAKALRAAGYEVFDNWIAAGPEADDYWQKYEKEKGATYVEALQSYEAQHVFNFDKYHLDRCDMAVLVMPGGKSAHLELGYMVGKGKPSFFLFDKEPDRFDVMPAFVYTTGGAVCFSIEELIEKLPRA